MSAQGSQTIKERLRRWRRGLNAAAGEQVSWRTLLLILCIGLLIDGLSSINDLLTHGRWQWRDIFFLGVGVYIAIMLARHWEGYGELESHYESGDEDEGGLNS